MSNPPDESASGAPPPAPKSSPLSGDAGTKPAFKVTRSPFSPRIGGGASSSPMAIGATAALGSAAAPTKAGGAGMTASGRPISTGRKRGGEETTLPLFVIDLLAAGVAIAFCAIMLVNYLNK
jgi:hypothetical protein